jgi:hypothetical protein
MILQAVAGSSLTNGVMEGLIILLSKSGIRESLNNWRPITLLNVSHKILAKALQMRLQSVFMEVISSNQSTFMPMRFILDNIFLTHETIHYAKQSQQPLLFLKLDFSKAYDKVDLPFLFQAMRTLGFPESFTHLTRLLFQNAAAQVSVNGQVTEAFSIEQGVRQGCLLVPYLFLVVEKSSTLRSNVKHLVAPSEASTSLARLKPNSLRNTPTTPHCQLGEKSATSRPRLISFATLVLPLAWLLMRLNLRHTFGSLIVPAVHTRLVNSDGNGPKLAMSPSFSVPHLASPYPLMTSIHSWWTRSKRS